MNCSTFGILEMDYVTRLHEKVRLVKEMVNTFESYGGRQGSALILNVTKPNLEHLLDGWDSVNSKALQGVLKSLVIGCRSLVNHLFLLNVLLLKIL